MKNIIKPIILILVLFFGISVNAEKEFYLKNNENNPSKLEIINSAVCALPTWESSAVNAISTDDYLRIKGRNINLWARAGDRHHKFFGVNYETVIVLKIGSKEIGKPIGKKIFVLNADYDEHDKKFDANFSFDTSDPNHQDVFAKLDETIGEILKKENADDFSSGKVDLAIEVSVTPRGEFGRNYPEDLSWTQYDQVLSPFYDYITVTVYDPKELTPHFTLEDNKNSVSAFNPALYKSDETYYIYGDKNYNFELNISNKNASTIDEILSNGGTINYNFRKGGYDKKADPIITQTGKYNPTITIPAQLLDGQEYYLSIYLDAIMNKNHAGDCHYAFMAEDNVATLKALAPLSAPDGNDEEEYFCPPQVSIASNETSKIEINGEPLKGGNNDLMPLYGIVYTWEYKINEEDKWHELPTNCNSNSSEPRLKLDFQNFNTELSNKFPNKKIEKYTFRQCAIISNFKASSSTDNAKYPMVDLNSIFYTDYKNCPLIRYNKQYTYIPREPITKTDFKVSLSSVKDNTNKANYCSEKEIHDVIIVEYASDSKKSEICDVTVEYPFKAQLETFTGKVVQDKELSIPFTITSLEAGEYEIEVTLKDECSNKVVHTIPFKVTQTPDLIETELAITKGGTILPEPTDDKLLNIYASGNFTMQFSASGDIPKDAFAIKTNEKNQTNFVDDELEIVDLRGIGNNFPNAYQIIGRSQENKLCESEPITLNITYFDNLNAGQVTTNTGNAIKQDGDTYYTCKKSKAQLFVTGTTGGFNNYDYSWEYSTDGENYFSVSDEEKPIKGNILNLENWSKDIDQTYYFRCKVTSYVTDDTKDINNIVGYTEPITVKPFEPIAINVAFENTKINASNEVFFCYNTTPDLDKTSTAVGNSNANWDDTNEKKYYWFKQNATAAEKNEINSDFTFNTAGATLFIEARETDVCENVIVSDPIKVTVGKDLLKGVGITAPECLVIGKEATFTINNVGANCTPVYTILSPNNQSNQSNVKTNKVPVTPVADEDITFKYSILDTVTKCAQIQQYKVSYQDFKKPLQRSELEIVGVNNTASTGETGKYEICAGTEIKIRDKVESDINEDLKYSWYIMYDDDTKVHTTSYNGRNVSITKEDSKRWYDDSKGTIHVVRKTYDNCRNVEDKITIVFKKAIEDLKIDPIAKLCYDKTLNVKVTSPVIGGTTVKSPYRYNYTFGSESETSTESSSHSFENVKQSGKLIVEAMLNECLSLSINGDSTYYYKKIETDVNIEENLEFSFTAYPPFILEEDIADKSVTVQLTPNFKPQPGDIFNLNGRQITYSSNEDFQIKLEKTDFKENLYPITLERVKGECSFVATQSISLCVGFSKAPTVVNSVTETITDTALICENSAITLYPYNSLPTFNGENLDKSSINYVWSKQIPNGWVVLNDIEDDDIEIDPATGKMEIANGVAGTTDKYRFRLDYNVDGDIYSVYSNEFSVKYINKGFIQGAGFVGSDSKKTNTYAVCKGSSGTVTLSVDTMSDKIYHLQWQYKTPDNNWEDVKTSPNTSGVKSEKCIIDITDDFVRESPYIYFRLKGTDECSDNEVYSKQIELQWKDIPTIDPGFIKLLSSNTYSADSVGLKEFTFGYSQDYDDYFWTLDPKVGAERSFTKNDPVTLTSENYYKDSVKVFVYKQSKSAGACKSEIVQKSFPLYQKISVGNFYIGIEDTLCNDNKEIFTLNADKVKGGKGNLKIVWQFKGENDATYKTIELGKKEYYDDYKKYFDFPSKNGELIDSALITEADEEVGEGEFVPYISAILRLKNPKQSMTFRIQVNGLDENGEVRDRIYSKEDSIKVYPVLTADPALGDDETICYNTTPSIRTGSEPQGGSNNYSYLWQYSLSENNWAEVDTLSQSKDLKTNKRLTQSGYIRRIVTDKKCKSYTDTSYIKRIEVLEKDSITIDEIIYPKEVLVNKQVTIQVKNPDYIYQLYDNNRKVLEDSLTTKHSGYTTQQISKPTNFYLTKNLANSYGCKSVNEIEIQIKPLDVNGGKIFLNSDAKELELCSGEKIERITSNQTSNPLYQYKWFFMINDGILQEFFNARNLCTLSETDIDSIILQQEKFLFHNEYRYGDEDKRTSKKQIKLWRSTIFDYVNSIGDIVLEEAFSDTLIINVKPTMELVGEREFANLTGGAMGYLSTEKFNDGSSYIENGWCKTTPYVVNYNVKDTVLNYWEANIKNYQTWWEISLGNNKWEKDERTVKTNKDQVLSSYTLDLSEYSDLCDTLSVRFALSDDCYTSYTNTIGVIIYKERAEWDEFSTFAYEKGNPDAYINGFETGDSLVITDKIGNYNNNNTNTYWFRDKNCKDTIASATNKCSVILDEQIKEIYVKRQNKETLCWGEVTKLPLTYYRNSTGGSIAYANYQKQATICYGAEFDGIIGLQSASGVQFTPDSREKHTFRYSWEVSLDGNFFYEVYDLSSADFPANRLNQEISSYSNANKFYIRRVAANEFDRIVYSDTVELGYYDEFKGGIISLTDDNFSYCNDNELPKVISTQPTGGKENTYRYNLEISINGSEYKRIFNDYLLNYTEFDLEYLIDNDIIKLDNSIDNTLSIRAIYKNGLRDSESCGDSIYSNVVNLTIYRISEDPSIYQNNASCDPDFITVKAHNQNNDYQFTWYMLIGDSIIWENSIVPDVLADSMIIPRIPVNPQITGYAVIAKHVQTQCYSGLTYFNVDSLPELRQEALIAPDKPYCYGSQLELIGGTVTGGNGEVEDKTYTWEYSLDSVNYTTFTNEKGANLIVNNLTQTMFVRRIVSDICYIDTSNVVKVSVLKNIHLDDLSFLTIYDYVCNENSNSNHDTRNSIKFVKGKETLDSFLTSYPDYYDLEFYITTEEEPRLRLHKGFYDNYINEPYDTLRHIYAVGLDSFGNRCTSNQLPIMLHSVVAIDSISNIISTDMPNPCNNEVISITGGNGYVGAIDTNITYNWYISMDNEEWVQIPNEHSKDLKIEVIDTVYIKRSVYHDQGNSNKSCRHTKYSNVLTIKGKPLSAHNYVENLAIEVVTMLSDSSNIVTLYARNNIVNNYTFDGDADVPTLQYGANKLPYTAEEYKDTALTIKYVVDGCHTTYNVNPLRGGRINLDGENYICPGSTPKELVVSDIEGGSGNYTYQWQYRNEYFTSEDFVNIDSEDAKMKNYQPSKDVKVKTWYRRITTDGEYKSISNVVAVSILEEPIIIGITPADDSTYYANNGIEITAGKVIKYASTPITLSAKVKNAESIIWKQNDIAFTPEMKVSFDDSTKITLHDSLESKTYILVASNRCHTTIKEIEVTTRLDLTPIATGEIVEYVSQDKKWKCAGDDYVLEICDYIDENGYKQFTQNYNYVITGRTNKTVYDWYISKEASDTIVWDRYTPFRITFDSVVGEKEIIVERISRITGASTKKKFTIGGETFKANFEFAVLTQNADTKYDASEARVEIEQGALVRFYSSGNQTLKSLTWLLEECENYFELYPDTMPSPSNIASQGLYSHMENPYCYYYQGGVQRVTMFATSEIGCKDTVVSTSLYLPKENVKSNINRGNGFIDEDFIDLEEWVIKSDNVISVYPTIATDYITIDYPKNHFEYTLMDESGKRLIYGSGENRVEVNISFLMQGNYLLQVQDNIYKVIKK